MGENRSQEDDEWTFSLLTGDDDVSLQLSSSPKPSNLESVEVDLPQGETRSLLQSEGWIFSGPNWSLQSRILLKITYRPAWQALPQYTHCGMMSRCCARSIDTFVEEYTTQHIHKVEQLPAVQIRGVGKCRGLRILLKARNSSMEVPERYRQALQDQLSLSQQDLPTLDKLTDSLSSPPWEDDSGNEYGPILTFCMPITHDGPPLLWKMEMPPNPQLAVEAYTVLDGTLLQHEVLPTHIYIHGYQSWSFSGSVQKGDKQPKSAMPNVFSYAFNHGGDAVSQKAYTSDFFTCITSDGSASPDAIRPFLDETGGPALLLGWLSQHEHLGVISVNENLSEITMDASADACILKHSQQTDWAYAQLIAPHSYDEEPMVHYLHAVAAYNQARPLQNGPLLTGWCSWYHYYEGITAANLRENFVNLQEMRKTVPTNVAVVDDGYMTAWGDWNSLKPDKFPSGLKGVAQDIKSFGMRPGLWLAPYSCDKKSQLAKQHPDWIIRNDAGRAANSANCGKFFYGLDATNPNVRDYVHSCVRRAVQEWGYSVLKIDFLYAACLEGNGKFDLSLTRAQAMHLALDTLREAAGPDVFLIGCGCPIGTAVGYVDGQRVSADTGPTWYPTFPFPWWDNGTLPALRAMIRNSMSRAPLGHRWWHNDPDCLLLGETTRLTDVEVASAASIVAMTCGMLLLSDDLTQVSPNRMKILTKIFPMTGATAVVLDLHNTKDGLPSLLRCWCTDRYYHEMNLDREDPHQRSSLLARESSFSPDRPLPRPSDRKRNCIHVTKGLGTWNMLSISNWLDQAAFVHIPSVALEAPPSGGWEDDASFCSDTSDENTFHYGYHVFSFWSSSYTWMPEAPDAAATGNHPPSVGKRLAAHETEIFHLREVTPDVPQYVGSDIHFSCGQELSTFEASGSSVELCLPNNQCRNGHIYLFIPRHDLAGLVVQVNGKACTAFRVVGNTPGPPANTTDGRPCIGRIVCIPVVVHGDGSKQDSQVLVKF